MVPLFQTCKQENQSLDVIRCSHGSGRVTEFQTCEQENQSLDHVGGIGQEPGYAGVSNLRAGKPVFRRKSRMHY